MEIRVTCDTKDMVNLDDLRVIQGQLKTLSEENFAKLKNQIINEGFSFPCFVWEHNGLYNLLDGTHRYLTLVKLKQEGYEIPLIPIVKIDARDLSHAKKKLLAVTSSYAKMDKQGLYEFLDDVDWPIDDIGDFELEGIDKDMFMDEFFKEESELDESKEDEVPDVEENPIVKRGEVWLLGEHRVMCGDSTVKEDVDKLMNGEKSELLFTSPPYSDMREYNGNKDLSVSSLINFISAYSEKTNYQVINLGLQRKNNEIYDYWTPYIDKAKESGYLFLSWNIWDKGEAGSIGNQTAMFPLEHEWIFVFGKGKKPLNKTIPCIWGNKKSTANSRRNKDGSLTKVDDIMVGDKKAQGSVYRVGALKARNLDTSHPAAFTVDFAEGYIEAMTNSKDSVAEPFCGSGSTLIACEKTNRKCYGMELDEKYCDVIIKRWQEYSGKEAIRESDSVNFNNLHSESLTGRSC